MHTDVVPLKQTVYFPIPQNRPTPVHHDPTGSSVLNDSLKQGHELPPSPTSANTVRALTAQVLDEVVHLHLALGLDVGREEVRVEHDDGEGQHEHRVGRLQTGHELVITLRVPLAKHLTAGTRTSVAVRSHISHVSHNHISHNHISHSQLSHVSRQSPPVSRSRQSWQCKVAISHVSRVDVASPMNVR